MPNRFFDPQSLSCKTLRTVSFAAILTLLSSSAEAGFKPVGFQWVAPQEATAPVVSPAPAAPGAMPAPMLAPAPTNGNGPEIISPIVIEGAPTSPPAPANGMPGNMPPASQPSMQPLPPASDLGIPSSASQMSAAPSAPVPPPPAMPGEMNAITTPNPPPDMSAANAAGNAAPAIPPSPVLMGGDIGQPSSAPEPVASPPATELTSAPPPLPMPPQPMAEAMPVNTQQPTVQPPMTSAMSSPPVDSGMIVQGFANSVPLAVGLRQVLPPGYGFSIDQDVDLGTLVSFQGGKPWRETLQEMLQPANLMMREEDKMVAISRTQPVATMIPPPAVPATASSPQIASAAAPSTSNPAPLLAEPPPSSAIRTNSALMSNGPYRPKPNLAQPSVPKLPLPSPSPLISSLHVAPAPIVDTWAASRGDTLHKVLQEWSRHANVEFQWSSEYDYPLQASVSFTGTFEEAVRGLLSGFEEAHPQPVAELHSNSGAGQMVLVVQTRGNSYSD